MMITNCTKGSVLHPELDIISEHLQFSCSHFLWGWVLHCQRRELPHSPDVPCTSLLPSPHLPPSLLLLLLFPHLQFLYCSLSQRYSCPAERLTGMLCTSVILPPPPPPPLSLSHAPPTPPSLLKKYAAHALTILLEQFAWVNIERREREKQETESQQQNSNPAVSCSSWVPAVLACNGTHARVRTHTHTHTNAHTHTEEEIHQRASFPLRKSQTVLMSHDPAWQSRPSCNVLDCAELRDRGRESERERPPHPQPPLPPHTAHGAPQGGTGEISRLPPLPPLWWCIVPFQHSSSDDVINAASFELAGLGVPSPTPPSQTDTDGNLRLQLQSVAGRRMNNYSSVLKCRDTFQ